MGGNDVAGVTSALMGLYPFFLALFFLETSLFFFPRSELVRGPDSQLHGGGPRSAPADTRARTLQPGHCSPLIFTVKG